MFMQTIFYIIILIFSGTTSCSLDEDIQLKQAIKMIIDWDEKIEINIETLQDLTFFEL